MPRPAIAPITRALDFIETGAPDAVREFMTHAREVCLRRGIIISGFPTGRRKARAAKAVPEARVSDVWAASPNPPPITTIAELPLGESIFYTQPEFIKGIRTDINIPAPPFRLLRNAARCTLCDEVIESRYEHDYVTCKGNHFFIDGGLSYLRHGTLGHVENAALIDLSEYAADTTPEPVYTEHGA